MNDVSQHLISGGLSGFTSSVFLQPFDLLKTRIQQVEGTLPKHSNAALIVRTAREIVAANGLQGLWRGTTATLLRNVPGIALYLTGLNHTRTVLASAPYFAAVQVRREGQGRSVLPKLTTQGNLLAGASARVAVGVVLNPFSVLKARYESNLYAYSSLPAALGALVRAGPRELFRGAVPSAMRDAPYAGLFIACYELIKADLAGAVAPASPGLAATVHAGAGALAGALATLATQPFDVIKTKMQVRKEARYRGLLATVSTIWKQRGPLGFFDGASLRMTRKVLSSAIGWAVYEGVLMALRTTDADD